MTSIRGADTACRHGGDEFLVMLSEVGSPAMATAVAEKVRAHLGKVHVIDDYRIRMTASVGVALYPRDGATYEQLMRHADDGMFAAKAVSGDAFITTLINETAVPADTIATTI